MTLGQAQELTSKLAAAFPRDWAFGPDTTNTVYVEKFAALDRYEAARDAVDSLIETEERLPPIAKIIATYRQRWDRYSPPALAEGEPSEAEAAANRRRIAAMVAHLAGAAGHSATFEECEHEVCAEIRALSVHQERQDLFS